MKSDFVYGHHAVHAFLLHSASCAIALYLYKPAVDKPHIKSLLQLAKQHELVVHFKNKEQLSGLLPSNACHQGIVLEVKNIPMYDESTLQKIIDTKVEPVLFLVLDGVQDPHNLGACLRSANAHGVQALIIPKHHAATVTPVVRKVACGAAEATPVVQVTNLVRTLKALKEQGVWLVGMDAQQSVALPELDLKSDIAIIMGSEGSGIRRLTKETCDFLAHIPMYGAVESINVSAATAISLYEARRQRS